MKIRPKQIATRIAGVFLIFVAGIATTGCSLMHEDLQPCAVKPNTKTTVKFVYDYNTDDTDLFASSVGGVTLYVFDSDEKLIAIEECNNATSGNALKTNTYKIEFDSSLVKPGESYSFYAVAHGHERGYKGALSMPGAAFRRTELSLNSHTVSDYTLTLDRDADGIVDHDGVMIDDIWATLTPVRVDIPLEKEPEEGDIQEPDHLIEVKIPLMRLTNHLTLTFWQTDYESGIDPTQYDVTIETSSGSGCLDITGNRISATPLVYKPVKVWGDNVEIDGRNVACVRAEFGLSRIMLNSDLKAVVRDKANEVTSTLPNLSSILSYGRDAYASKGWSAQEYLDRQHNFAIDFPLGNPIPKWVNVNIDILSWSKRYQIENL